MLHVGPQFGFVQINHRHSVAVEVQEEFNAAYARQPCSQARGKSLPFKQLHRHRHAGLRLKLRTCRLQQVGQAVGILDLQLHDITIPQATPRHKPKGAVFGAGKCQE